MTRVLRPEQPVPLGSLAAWDDAHLVADGGREIFVWDVPAGALVARQAIGASCRDGHPHLGLAVDGTTLAAADGIRELALWDLDRLTLIGRFAGHTEEVRGVAFLDGDRVVSGSGDSSVRFWERQTGRCVETLSTSPVHCLAASRLIAAGGSLGAAGRVWLIEGTAIVRTLDATGPIVCLAWHPEGRLLATGGWDALVRVFDSETGQERCLAGHRGWVNAVAWLDEHRLVSGGADGHLRIWDGDRCLDALPLTGGSVEGLCVLGGRICAASDDGAIYVV